MYVQLGRDPARLPAHAISHMLVAGETRRQIWSNDGKRCHYCRRPLKLREMTLDHKVPRARGGKHVLDNLVSACADCNQRKGMMSYQDFRETCRRWTPHFKPAR